MNAQRSLFQDQAPTVDEVMAVWTHDRGWRSRQQIATALGRSKSPSLIAVVNVLVAIGYLTCRNDPLPNGVNYFTYSPAQKWYDDASPF